VGKERLIEAFSDTVMKASKELMKDFERTNTCI